MQLTDKQQDMIFAYLNNDLSEAERTEFETELTKNELLRKEFHLERAIFMSVELDKVASSLKIAKENNMLKEDEAVADFQIIRNNLQQAKINNTNKQRRMIRRWVIAGLAAACILLGLRFSFLRLQPDISPQVTVTTDEKIKTFYIDEPIEENSPTLASSAVEKRIIKRLRKVDKTKENNLNATQDNINGIRKQFGESDAIVICEARIHYLKKENKKSIKLLNELIEKDSEYVEDARWYLSLIYLQNDQKCKARQLLKLLEEKSEKYNDDAQKELKEHRLENMGC